MMADETILQVRGLCKYFPVYGQGIRRKQVGLVRAVDEVSFDLQAGRTLGLVGESGCGKTTTARTILRALKPTSGQVLFRSDSGVVDLATLSARRLKALRTEVQMIFQDPFSSLNPRMTVEQIVGEPLKIHRLADRAERSARIAAILRKVGLDPDHRNRYPHEFSGGQRQRIGIARALVLEPRLVVADEAVSALDVSVQAQVINLLEDLQEDLALTYIFVAHDLSVVRHISDSVAVMYAGRIVEMAPTERIFEAPRHPYTRALMAAVPHPDPDHPMDATLSGDVADPADLPPGCAFAPRCRECRERCRRERPELRWHDEMALAACHLVE